MALEMLLTKISNINKMYEVIYKFSGEKFNIFNLLNLSGNELSHSKIIATLLDQKGMHGKDNKFLELFLSCIGIKDYSINNVITETEKFIGPISDDNTKGGRIDILLKDENSKQIFIENKIYANDGENQLLRYNKYDPKADLLYLTLDEREPSENSIPKDMKDKYTPISYKVHILKWLELCKKESIDNPILRETLTQYIVLINQLTGQTRSKEMQKEILDVILKDVDNISAAFNISHNIDEIKLQILKDKFEPLMCNLKEGFDLEISFDWCFSRYWGFSFVKEEWKKYVIRFQFESSNLQNLSYGLCIKEQNLSDGLNSVDIPHDLIESLRSLNYKTDPGFLFWKFIDNYRFWNEEFFIDLFSNNNKIKDVFKNKIEEISLIVEEYKLQI